MIKTIPRQFRKKARTEKRWFKRTLKNNYRFKAKYFSNCTKYK